MTRGDLPIPGSPSPQASAPAPAPRRKMNWWVVAVFLAIGTVTIYLMESSRPQTATTNHPSVGKQPAALRLEPLNVAGPAVTLESLQGNVAVLTFFCASHPTSRGEISLLAELAREWGHDRVRILPVSCLPNPADESQVTLDTETEILLDETHVDTLTIYRDPDQVTRNAFRELGAFNTCPTTLILDARGRVRAVIRGYHLVENGRDIRAVLTQELKR